MRSDIILSTGIGDISETAIVRPSNVIGGKPVITGVSDLLYVFGQIGYTKAWKTPSPPVEPDPEKR